MANTQKTLLEQALELPAAERAVIAEQLLLSLDRSDSEIDAIWASEVEERIEAFEQGNIQDVSVSKVFGKYETR